MWQSGHVFILSYSYLLYIHSGIQVLFSICHLWIPCGHQAFSHRLLSYEMLMGLLASHTSLKVSQWWIKRPMGLLWTFMFLNIKKNWFSRKNVCFFISLKWHVSETFFSDSPFHNGHSDYTEIMACPLRVCIDRFPLYFLSEYTNFDWLKVRYPFYDQKYFFTCCV